MLKKLFAILEAILNVTVSALWKIALIMTVVILVIAFTILGISAVVVHLAH